MTNADELIALAERCEAATGPDRMLDLAIAVAVGEVDDRTQAVPRGGFGYVGGGQFAVSVVPTYTASLDAAMMLVPDGIEGLPLSFKVERFYLGNGITKCRATVWDGLGRVSSLDTASEAATPALALCAAALRARAAHNSTGLVMGRG